MVTQKLKRNMIIINSIFFVLMAVTDYLYITKGNAYVFKTLASSVFVLCGIVNILMMLKYRLVKNKKFYILLMLGLCFAMAGDVLLIEHFIIGAVSFAIGHIFYFLSYLCLKKLSWLDLFLALGVITISVLVILLAPLNFRGMMPLIMVYAVVISIMLSKSISLFWGKNKKIAIICFVGSLMFFLSDLFLMIAMFSNIGRVMNILCLAFYYPAEIILAYTPSVVAILDEGNTEQKADIQNIQ